MRRFYTLALVCLFFLPKSSVAQFPAPYCPEAFASNVEPITKVVFANINNTTSATVGGTNAHENFTAIVGTVLMGTTYSFQAQGNTDGSFTTYVRVFIDWNNNGVFTDAGESFDIGTIVNSTGTDGITATANIAIPNTATPGNLRMRVSKKFAGFATPCNTAGFGQAEDYTLFVVPPTPCSGTPVTTAVANPTNVCLGSPFTLNLTGLAIVSGLSYQWQSSPDNTNWTDISGATSSSLITTQSVTTYYRARVTCASVGGGTGFSSSALVTSPPLVSGTFTINNSIPASASNFQTFNAAYNYMKCGINGPVVFNVQTGTGSYNEQLIMSAIPGTSPTNTVTFKGNGAAIIGFGSTNSNERAVIKLKGTRYIIFDSLIINANTSTYGYGVQLMSDADSNIVRNCTINSSTTSTATNFAGIVINGTDAGPIAAGVVLCDYNTFSNNTIIGGYYGITLYATFSGGASGNNRFIKNDVRDFYLYGMYVGGSYNTLIERNTFSRPTRTPVGDFNGIYFTTEKNTGDSISKNRFKNPFGGVPTSTANFYGINFNSSDGSVGAENVVSNNLIYDVNGNGPQYGIANTGSDYVYYLHNTISLDNALSTSGSTTRGFYQTTTAGGLFFYNNIISITRGGTGTKHCIYLQTGLLAGANNNNYYINAAGGSNSVGFYTANRTLLSDWKTATGLDGSSISANPAYIDQANENYAPGNAGIDNKGIYVGIDFDINNTTRSTSTPDIGAYEFTPPACSTPPVTGNTSLSVVSICQNNPVFLTLVIGPYGSAQTFQWQTSTSASGTFTSFGSPMLTPDTTINASTTLYYRAAVTCGSTTVYTTPVLLTVIPALPSGIYTIDQTNPTSYTGPGTGTNFNSFNAVKAAMNCGITGGPVVFNVVAGTGPYVEQLKLDSIKGTSVINTITFNGLGNTISFSSSNSNERAVIKLNGADYIIFDSLTIDASVGTYGYGVQLINRADSNVFRRCTIISSITSSSSTFAGIVINATDAGPTSSGNTFCDANLFDRNTITGGYYGATVVGGTTAGTFINDNKFTNNTIKDFYFAGIYSSGNYNTLIEGNTFTRPTIGNTSANVYGVYAVTAPSNRLFVSKNRFTKFFGGLPLSTAAFYGVYHNNVDASAGSESVVSNNLFYDLDGNGPLYCFHNTGSDNVRYYHNTLSIDNTSSTATGQTAGFYQTTQAVGLEFKDNIVTISRGGTGLKHALYFATTASEIASNNNDFYLAAQNSFTGYNGANRLTLAEWISSTTKDANSFNSNPLFSDPATGNFKPQLASLDDKGVPVGIPTDILNVARNATTPDIGAYEFSPSPCQTPPVAGIATVTPNSGICLEAPITLDITGHSPLGTLTFQWQSSANGTTNWSNISPLQYFPQFNTLTTTSTYYRAAVTCNGNTVYTNIVNVTLNNILLAGTYTINPGQPISSANFQSFQGAVSALLCGITGPVIFNVAAGTYNEQIRIPYIPGTSNVNTVTFQSANGLASSVDLSFNSTTSAANYTLKLDSTKNFIFRNLTLSATDANFGRVIDLSTTTSSDSILSCKIVAPVTNITSNNNVGIYASGFKGTNMVIKGNTISNGANGIYFAGTSPVLLTSPSNLIDANTVAGAYSHGIFLQNTNRLKVTNNIVSLLATPASNTAGIYSSNSDSGYRFTGNTVNINNVTGTPVYGMYILNTHAIITDSAIVASNKIIAETGNTGIIYGLAITGSKGIHTVNNVIAINSAGVTAYGLYNLNNVDQINYYNNTVNLLATSTNGYAGYFTQNVAGPYNVINNIFSNSGGGRALFVNNPAFFNGDYNMLYTTGANLVQVSTGGVTNFASLLAWKNTWNWDRSSISFAPAFISNIDLSPNLNNPDVWAMHGRGLQVKGNTFDFNNNYRPDFLTAGVPDLGAYEFFPNVLPSVLLATPSTPAANSTQIFSYGTDTVMKITWGATAPPSVEVRRFSGVVPTGLLPGTDSMFFYTKVNIPGGSNYNYSAKLYYIDSWQGSIPQQAQLGLGRTTPSNAWVVGANSKVDISKKEISQDAIAYLDRFTGLVNPFSQPEVEDSSSNRGKDFWVGYQRTNGFSDGNVQTMKLYLGAAAVTAHVTVTIEGTTGIPWVRNYTVPPNSALTSDDIPKTAPDDARLVTEGLHVKKGIHIVSDVPVVAYAHIYESTNSGATMLMPTAVWGYEYYILTSRQNYTSTSYSAFHIVAQSDSTWVEINPAKPTLNGWVPNGGTQPNGSYLVKLNKGDAYQVLGAIQSGAEGYDLTGSYVKSIGNNQGQCSPIAVFSGSTRTGIGCGGAAGSSGDLIIQQVFPYQAWGNKYATAPTSNDAGPNASSNMTNIYRVLVKDTTTIVKRNNIQLPLASLINKRYYQFESSTADYIESNKPVLVAEYMSSNGSCTNTGSDGDPEMFYLSPIQQAIKSTQFYRNNLTAIDENFITMVIPTEGLSSLRIDGINYLAYPTADRYVYNHPNLPGYSVVSKRWVGGNGSSTVESDLPFTGIVYGIGSVESYGYNLGTLVKNLNNLSTVNNVLNTGANPTEYTCKGAPFRLTALLPIVPTSIKWLFGSIAHLSPRRDTIQNNPVATDTVTVNGIDYYAFTLTQNYSFDSAGVFRIPIQYSSPTIERCDQKQDGTVIVQVLPSPITDFKITYPNGGTQGCEGDVVNFVGDIVTQNGIALNQWNWTFSNGTTPSGQTQTFTYPAPGTYPVKLTGITADGCISDTLKQVVINPKPVVNVTVDSVASCPGNNVTFTIANPVTGVTYNWYNAATGGTIAGTGSSFTATNITPPVNFYVEGISTAGCTSVIRKKVVVSSLPALVTTTLTAAAPTANSVTFNWTAVAGAASYQVSVNNGAFITPSSGATGLTHTVSGLGTLQSVCIVVKAIGANSCQTSLSASVCSCTNSAAVVSPDSLAVCTGANATFNVQNPVTGITYTWYTTLTGGTALATGSSFTVNNVTGSAVYYVQQAAAAGGCTGSTRTRVVVSVFTPLAVPVVTSTGSTATTVTFGWNAVPGAVSYSVSVNGGAFVNPSSGATGLTHVVTGLGTLQSVSIVVRANGANTCQNSLSASVSGCTNSAASATPDSLAICSGSTTTFSVLNPVAGLTYTWYAASTGGTPLATGLTFTTPVVTTTTNFYLQQSSAAGCVSSTRTKVTVTILAPLTAPVATVDMAGPNFVTFKWNAVAGATGYQVSLDNGATYISPSSGATGLTHTVTGLTPLQQVTLIVRALGNIACQNSVSTPVTGRALSDQIFIPNTFTPNGDGRNDVLLVYSYAIKEMQFMIFNQWGEKVFETRNQATGWDGSYKGKQQPVGVYIYVSKMTLLDGSVVERKGSINLVR